MSLELITEELIARQPAEAQTVIRLLLAQLAEMDTELKALKKAPQNSSLPPSTQHPQAKPAPPKTKSPQKRGGQPGHARCERPLIPSVECARVVACQAVSCRRCGRGLSGRDPAPLRHQVWELPEIKPVVIEYPRHRLSCPCCQETTCAELPVGVPSGQSGPRLTAFVRLLMACFRQSKRRTALFLEAIVGQLYRHRTARRETTGARSAATNEAAVPTVASPLRSAPHPHRTETRAGPRACCGGTAAASRSSREDLRHLPGTAATPPRAVDVPRPRRRRTHKQRQ